MKNRQITTSNGVLGSNSRLRADIICFMMMDYGWVYRGRYILDFELVFWTYHIACTWWKAHYVTVMDLEFDDLWSHSLEGLLDGLVVPDGISTRASYVVVVQPEWKLWYSIYALNYLTWLAWLVKGVLGVYSILVGERRYVVIRKNIGRSSYPCCFVT